MFVCVRNRDSVCVVYEKVYQDISNSMYIYIYMDIHRYKHRDTDKGRYRYR